MFAHESVRAEKSQSASIRICADDYGLNSSVNKGILELCHLGRLDAVSCIVGGTAFAEGAADLVAASRRTPAPIEIGLHLTLTEFQPLGDMAILAPDGTFPQVGKLLLAGFAGRLDQEELVAEITRQVTRFQEVFGFKPDFIDGHQHAHLVPGVGQALKACEAGWRSETTWVRACGCPVAQLHRLPTSTAKSGLLAALSHHLHRQFDWPHNAAFYGVNGFQPDEGFGDFMQSWLDLAGKAQQGSLIMVHPGTPSNDGQDVIAHRRPQELEFLRSDRFSEYLVHAMS